MEDPGLVLSVVIPAFNEAEYLPVYLPTVIESLHRWERVSGARGEIIVVDNASTDATAQIATEFGVRVVSEPVRNIGHVRNTGATIATGQYLFFTDADVALPPRGSRRRCGTCAREPARAARSRPSTCVNGLARGCCVAIGTGTAAATAAPRAWPSSAPSRRSHNWAGTGPTCT